VVLFVSEVVVSPPDVDAADQHVADHRGAVIAGR